MKRSRLTLLGAFVALHVGAQPSPRHGSEPSLPGYVVLLSDSVSMRKIVSDDSLYYNISRGVVFPVNRYDLNVNDSFLIDLRERVLPEVKRRGWELAGVGFRGAASPEGPYAWNEILSKNRAKAIIDYLVSYIGHPAGSRVSTSNVVEDYWYLVRLMREAGDPQTARIDSMVQQWGDNMPLLKKRMQAADGGRLWKRLLATYFPKLRTARLILFFRPKYEAGTILPGGERAIKPLEVPAMPMEPLEIECHEAVKEPRRHLLSVGTNLLYDAFYMPNYGWAPMPNVELEFYPRRGNWTALVGFTSPYWHRWSKNKFFQIRDYHFEARRYFRPGAWHTGWYAGAYVNNNKYGIGLSKTKGWQGEGFGGALKGGYVWQLGKAGCWRLEVTASAGIYVTRFDPYVYGNPATKVEDGDYYYDYIGTVADFVRRNRRRIWMGPTEVGVTLRRDLLFWRKEVGR